MKPDALFQDAKGGIACCQSPLKMLQANATKNATGSNVSIKYLYYCKYFTFFERLYKAFPENIIDDSLSNNRIAIHNYSIIFNLITKQMNVSIWITQWRRTENEVNNELD